MADIRWTKQGLIHSADGDVEWARTHAQIPTVEFVSEESVGVLYATRDKSNRSSIGKLLLRRDNLKVVEKVYSRPVLELGAPGAFDDCGAMPSSLVEHNGVRYLYYIGWNARASVPYHNSVGLAVSEDGGESYSRLHDGPVMDRTSKEPYFCGTTCIHIESGIWRNWYMSCTGWYQVGNRMEPRYHLKYAESSDGVNWRREGRVAIDYSSEEEGGIARATILRGRDGYRMWFCYRALQDYREDKTSSYRIGFAESPDGLVWSRRDDSVHLDVSASGWDSEMMAYPEVVDLGDNLVMFYNGNGFGCTGFGYATSTDRI